MQTGCSDLAHFLRLPRCGGLGVGMAELRSSFNEIGRLLASAIDRAKGLAGIKERPEKVSKQDLLVGRQSLHRSAAWHGERQKET